MNQKRKTILAMVFFVLFIVVVSFLYTTLKDYYKQKQTLEKPQQTTEKKESKISAPDFTVLDAKGNRVSLSDFKGKPVVLNFWASWCPPCKQEMPHFNEVYQSEKDSVVFLMVDLVDGQRETVETGKAYIKAQNYDFPVYSDYVDQKQQAAELYGISSIPTTYFIDSEGTIITGYQGAMEKETLIKGINRIKNK